MQRRADVRTGASACKLVLMQLVIFDLDGTLTQTTSVDAECYVRALADEAGIERINTRWSDYVHVTDSGITEQIFLEHRGRAPTPDELARLQRRFVTLLEAAFTQLPGSFTPMAGAAHALQRLQREPDWAVAIATGSWRASAMLKLRLAGIDIAGVPAAFADDSVARQAIVQTVLARSRAVHGAEHFDRVVCVGDAVWDIRTATAIGAAFVGVRADGRDAVLRNKGATHVVRDFTDFGTFLEALEQAHVPNARGV